MQRLGYIDALRGLAVLGVLFAHTTLFGSNVYPLWFKNLTSVDVGPRGVQLFYLVSAFTLCLTFSKHKKIEKHALKNFYIRRFFRIAPLFYIAIVYYLWQSQFWNGNPAHFSFLNILSTFTFTNGVSPYWINNIVFGGWSIAIESTFYLIFPFLFAYFTKFRFALIATCISLLAMQGLRLYLLSLPFIQNNPDFQTYTFQFFPSQLPVFLIGMTLFFLMTAKKINKVDKKIWLLCLSSLALLLLLQAVFKLKLIAGHYMYGLFFAFVLYFLAKYPLKILVNTVTTYLGKISFSLYLSHFAVITWLNRFHLVDLYPINPFINYALRFILLLACSTVISTVLYYVVEQNGQKVGKLLIRRNENKAV